MYHRVNFPVNYLNKYRRWILSVIIVTVVIRFAFMIYYNCTHGNTGKPGIQYLTDSYRYIGGADRLLAGEALDYKESQYSGYIALIAFVKLLFNSLEILIALQILMALISSLALFSLAKLITESNIAGVFAVGLYLLNPFITSWHTYIMTESLYTSFLIITVWSINNSIENKTVKNFVLSFIIVCITASIRPNGCVVMLVMFCFYIIYFIRNTYLKYACVFIFIVVFILTIVYLPVFNNAIQKIGTEKIVINEVLLNGEVIPDHKELRIVMPKDSTLINKNWTLSIFYFAKHPYACIKLATYRVATELLQIRRPWYSVKYSLRMFFWIWPAYLLAVFGIIFYRKKTSIRLILSVVFTNIFVIALTFADHESRFLNYLLPLIYVISACGFSGLIKKFYNRFFTKNCKRKYVSG